ncbi:MAG: signal peptidase II [Polyangiaceae bacterium]|jgi:signal peptidase II|nr:signal peptidase II [Polyangiaceae bacterium]
MCHIRKALLLLVILALVGCDHATKHAAKIALEGKTPLTLVEGVLSITYAENRGIAFSMLQYLPEHVSTPLLSGLAVIAVTAIAAVWWKRRRTTCMEHAGFALVVAGAVGNLIDRAARGYVVDFIHLRFWPIFNVADIWIVVGGALLMIAAWRHRRRTRAAGATAREPVPVCQRRPAP